MSFCGDRIRDNQFAIAGVVGRERNCAIGTILSILLVNEVCGTTIKSLNSHIRVLHILFGMTSFDIGVMSPQFYNAYAFKHILHLSSFLTKLRNQNPYMLLSPTRSRQYITKKFLFGIEINLIIGYHAPRSSKLGGGMEQT